MIAADLNRTAVWVRADVTTQGPNVVVTVDTEFFDSVFLYADDRPEPTERVRKLGLEGLQFVTDLLERHGATGTFFVLGEVAEQVPEVIGDLADAGHEIASHGHSKAHPDLREASPSAVRDELETSKRTLEGVTGEPVGGFRAPAFSVDGEVLAAVDEAGYDYDSSVVPCRAIPGFYGMPDAPRAPFDSGDQFSIDGVTEFPLAVAPLLRLPISGAWMRLLGRQYAVQALDWHVKHYPLSIVYVHPWELVDLPRIEGIPKRVYWRTGEYTRRTLERIVTEHADRLTTLRDVAAQYPTAGNGPSSHA